MMFDGTCKRRDRAMAGVVNTALSMQRVAGRHAADDYLTRHQVPDKVIVRALSSSGQKREHRERHAVADGAAEATALDGAAASADPRLATSPLAPAG